MLTMILHGQSCTPNSELNDVVYYWAVSSHE